MACSNSAKHALASDIASWKRGMFLFSLRQNGTKEDVPSAKSTVSFLDDPDMHPQPTSM
jgi:hypothetical protein